MSWPFTPHQCRRCVYFEALEPPLRDDAGYALPGLCAHPQIGMELYVSRSEARLADCDLFRSAPAGRDRSVPSAASTSKPTDAVGREGADAVVGHDVQ
jgi:hypothetical protein